MQLMVATDVGSTKTTFSPINSQLLGTNDIVVVVNHKGATVAQVQSALTRLSTAIGNMGAGSSTLKSWEGQGGSQ